MSRATALERARLVIRGVRAELTVEDGRITIVKESPADAAARTVSFDVDRVRGSTLLLPPHGSRGWLHVAVAGGSPVPPGELAAAGDPYTLPIATRSTRAARRFSRLVEKHVRERGMPKEAGPNEGRYSSGVSLTEPPATPRGMRRSLQPSDAASPSVSNGRSAQILRIDEPEGDDDRERAAGRLVVYLRELAELHDAGVLDDDEFERAKARVLR